MSSQFDNKDRLIEALCKQEGIGSQTDAAAKIADVVTRKIYAPGDTIIRQNHTTDEMYFILGGRVAVMVNGRKINYRGKNQSVGEMSLVDVGGKRSATVIVEEESELARIESADFTKIANEHPVLWRNIAQSLASRLRERNARERIKNWLFGRFSG